MVFSDILKEKYEKCDDSTKLLFNTLVDQSNKYCVSSCSVNMKEFHYRLQKMYKGKGRPCQNFCLYTLTPSKNGITVHLRNDGIATHSEIFTIDVIRNSSYLKGQEWLKFSINHINQVDEAIRLIKYVYEYDS